MMNVAWFKNPDHVAYFKEEEILPKLSRELGINDLGRSGRSPHLKGKISRAVSAPLSS